MLTVNILGNNEAIGRIFFYWFIFSYLLFIMQMHILLALRKVITGIDFIPKNKKNKKTKKQQQKTKQNKQKKKKNNKKKKKTKLRIATATSNLSFLYFWCPITSFCLVLYFPFFVVFGRCGKKLTVGSGVGVDRFSRVTVNSTPKQSLHHVQVCNEKMYIFFKYRDCFYPNVLDES